MLRLFKVNFRGQTLIEFLLAMGLTAILLPVLLTSLTSSREGRAQEDQRLTATQLLQETQEAVRTVRERSWNEFATNGTFYPAIANDNWSLLPGTEMTGQFTRSVVISDVFRDSGGQIVTSGGSLDPATKQVVTTISWENPYATSIDSIQYYTRYLENTAYLETLQSEFDQGQFTSTVSTTTDGGEVVLASGAHGDWCNPTDFIVDQLDLPQSAAARDVKAIQGKAFTGTHVSSTGSFVEIDITNDSPPVSTIVRTIAGYETNDVFIDQNYAYIATGDISKDVVIIDLNTGSEVGYFNDSYIFGTAKGVFVSGNVGYVTIGFRLHTFDLSSKTGSRPELDSVSLGFLATGYRLEKVGNYAYVAVDWGNSELVLVNVTNPSNVSVAATANVNGERGQEVTVNPSGTRAYLATGASSSKNEFFVINTTNKSGSLPIIGSYDSSGMNPTGVTVVTGNKAILVGLGGEEYQVINIANEAAPVRCGGLQVNSGIYGVSSVLEADEDAYSYIVTGDSSNEFKIIEGGIGGGTYNETGEFTSRIFDAGSEVIFNRLIPDVLLPAETTMQFQVAITDSVSGSCNGAIYNYVGPDGTSSTYFPDSGGPLSISTDGAGYENPGRCLRYRGFFQTNDPTATPVINSLSINYSP